MSSVVDDMRGRVALVTGASAGIGRQVASGLAERGATVLAVSRAGGAGAAFVEELRRATGNPDHRFLPADLSAQAEIRAVAAEVVRQVPRLDVLVNNAGGFFPRRTLTVDGIERTFALDHLAAMLLTLLLLEPLATAGGRVLLTTSLVAPWGRVHRDVQLRRGYNGAFAYAQARLGNLLFARELARRVPASAVSINAFDPGVVRTELGQGPGFLNFCIRVAQAGFGREARSAAATALTLACSPELAGATGGLWRDGRRLATPRAARDARAARRLWEVSVRLLGLSEEELAPLRRLEARRRAAGP
jgi:retinol dehydrogenase 14